jgi:hypothetical protein
MVVMTSQPAYVVAMEACCTGQNGTGLLPEHFYHVNASLF